MKTVLVICDILFLIANAARIQIALKKGYVKPSPSCLMLH